MLRCFLIASLLIAPFTFVRAEDDTKSKVFDAIGDFAINRDDVLRRYAYSAVGESWREPPNSAPAVYPFCYMKIKDAKLGWDFDAQGMPLRKKNPFGQNEVWQQYLHHDGKFKIKAGTIRADKFYLTKPKEMRLSKFKSECGYYPVFFEPFDDILMVATFFTHSQPNPNSLEKVFLNNAELLSATKGIQDTIESKWHWQWGDYDLDVTLVQSPAHGNMPIRVQYKDRKPKYKKFFSDTHIEWKKQKDLWVPIRINAATAVNAMLPEPTGVQFFAKIDWLIGDEVTDEMMDPDASDHRIPLMDAFGRYFDVVVNGRTVGNQSWDRPEDLEIEVATKSRKKQKP